MVFNALLLAYLLGLFGLIPGPDFPYDPSDFPAGAEAPITFQDKQVGNIRLSLPEEPLAAVAAESWRLMLLLLVVLSWTPPLRDGNTPITDYTVEYRAADQEEWTQFDHPASPDTSIAISGVTRRVPDNSRSDRSRPSAMN